MNTFPLDRWGQTGTGIDKLGQNCAGRSQVLGQLKECPRLVQNERIIIKTELIHYTSVPQGFSQMEVAQIKCLRPPPTIMTLCDLSTWNTMQCQQKILQPCLSLLVCFTCFLDLNLCERFIISSVLRRSNDCQKFFGAPYFSGFNFLDRVC